MRLENGNRQFPLGDASFSILLDQYSVQVQDIKQFLENVLLMKIRKVLMAENDDHTRYILLPHLLGRYLT